MPQLIDTFGRRHSNLRISVTDRCNLRCTYCMPEDVTFMERAELLTFEEITHFVEVATSLGIDKVRLTGGEPLMRRDLAKLIRMLLNISGIKDLGLTTNALLLPNQAQSLVEAGLRRINISLDSLDANRFFELTRRHQLDQTLEGIHAAKNAGLSIKLNAVSIRGFTEHDVIPLAKFAREHELEMRFIEYMPIGAEEWERNKVYFAHEILDQIDKEICPVVPAENYDPHAPAMEMRYVDGKGKIGIIASVSRPFCHSCNRLRLTADGKLRNCLFALDETDIKTHLRDQPNDEKLSQAIIENVHSKWEGHEINTARFLKPLRTMHAIGG